jgi:hypothetical protein
MNLGTPSPFWVKTKQQNSFDCVSRDPKRSELVPWKVYPSWREFQARRPPKFPLRLPRLRYVTVCDFRNSTNNNTLKIKINESNNVINTIYKEHTI